MQSKINLPKNSYVTLLARRVQLEIISSSYTECQFSCIHTVCMLLGSMYRLDKVDKLYKIAYLAKLIFLYVACPLMLISNHSYKLYRIIFNRQFLLLLRKSKAKIEKQSVKAELPN